MREAKYVASVIGLIACLFGGGAVAFNAAPQVNTKDNLEIVEPACNVMTLAAETSVKTAATSKKEAEITNVKNVNSGDLVLNTLNIGVTDIAYIADCSAAASDTAVMLASTVQKTAGNFTDDHEQKIVESPDVTTTTTVKTTVAVKTTTTKASTVTTTAKVTEPPTTEAAAETVTEEADDVTENVTEAETTKEEIKKAETESAEKKETKKDNKDKEETNTASVPAEEDILSIDAADEENTLPITEKEYILLCNAVAHEAGSGWISTKDKACVVEVIMNRVYSSKYPNSIYGVLTQKQQFSGSGAYVNLDDYSGRVTENVKEAVLLYFNNIEDFDHGYLFFSGDGKKNYFY